MRYGRKRSQANINGYSCGVCRREGREREVFSGGGNGLSVQERDIPRFKTTNIIVMVLSENCNTSKLSSFLCIAEHFLPSQITLLDNLPGLLSRVHYIMDRHNTCTHMHTHWTTDISIPAYTLYAHISYIGIIHYR